MSQTATTDTPTSVWMDFLDLFKGKYLGSGIGREVYELTTDPTKVIKIEMTSASFQNVLEWETWNLLGETKWGNYLAPCHFISPCGIVLIQSKCWPLTPELEKTPLPDFLTDFKRKNYGVINGRVVCHDYGTSLLIPRGTRNTRMKVPDWWTHGPT